MKIEKIINKNEVVAYILRDIYSYKRRQFVERTNDFLQVGIMQIEKNEIINPHYHLPQKKIITKNQEVLIILGGKLEASFYANKTNKLIKKSILSNGDILVLLNCGHGFKILEKCNIIEVKQGPYEGQKKDKAFIEL